MEKQADISLAGQLPPGYRVQPFALDYAEETVDLLNMVTKTFIGSPKFSLAGMIGEWKLPEVDLDAHVRIILSPEGRVVAYGELWDIFKPYVHKYTFVRVHPDHTGRGLGSYLLRFGEQRALERLHLAPEGARVLLKAGCFGNDQAAARLLESQGFERARVFYTMKIALDQQPEQPRIPDGIVIRAIDREREQEAYFRANQEAFRDHYGFVEEPFEDYYRRWQHIIESDPGRFDPSLWLAAFDGDQIAGVCFNRQQMAGSLDMGWVGMVSVRRPWRRRGIAKAMLLSAFNLFYERGYKGAGLGVDASSLTGATRLYENAGMHVSSETHDYRKLLRDGEELATESVD